MRSIRLMLKKTCLKGSNDCLCLVSDDTSLKEIQIFVYFFMHENRQISQEDPMHLKRSLNTKTKKTIQYKGETR